MTSAVGTGVSGKAPVEAGAVALAALALSAAGFKGIFYFVQPLEPFHNKCASPVSSQSYYLTKHRFIPGKHRNSACAAED